ncbi:MAG: FAD:protein FMN transferase [Chloroflexi bacterium]|nr:FAD:protein FMN transferase [Chloroflexota bacterium]
MAAGTRAAAAAPPAARADSAPLVRSSHRGRAMGGRLGIHLALDAAEGLPRRARHDAVLVERRVVAWARILTRHDPASALMRLNVDPRDPAPVGPTLAAVLAWAADAEAMTGGIVDVTRLEERLAVETTATGGHAAPGGHADPVAAGAGPAGADPRGWRIADGTRRRALVSRTDGVRFDLDGVAKGWLADRALRLLRRYPGAVVDADGDVAVRVAPGDRWEVGVADPRAEGALLAVLVLDDGPGSPGRGRRRWGVATSGTTVHRFGRGAHHLIDPRTGRPAATDVVQATVLASGAAVAEAFAKTAVILGSAAGLDFLDRAGVAGAILLLEDDRVLALPRTMEFLG